MVMFCTIGLGEDGPMHQPVEQLANVACGGYVLDAARSVLA